MTTALVLCHVLAGLYWLYPRIGFVLTPPTEAGVLEDFAVPVAYGLIAMLGVYLCVLAAAVRRRVYAELILLMLLFCMAAVAVIDSVAL